MSLQNLSSVSCQPKGPNGDHVELSTFDLIPISVARIRRDSNSSHGKLRKKYINLSSSVTPIKIIVGNIECPFRITRGHNLIKVSVDDVLSSKDSGFHETEIKLFHKHGTLSLKIVIDFRARGHYRKIRSYDSGETGDCNQ